MTQRSKKAEIVMEYLKKYPKEPTRTIARMLLTKYPEVYSSFSAIRSMVMRYRNEIEQGKYKGRTIVKEAVRTKEERMRALSNVIESDYKENEDYQMPTTANKVLVLSDIHFPYQDQKALDVALEYGYKNGCNAIYLNGDVLDMYQASRYNKDPRLRDIAGELEMGKSFLDYLKSTFNKPVFYKMGNHEDRFEHYLQRKAPELFSIPEFRLDVLMGFGERGVILVKSRQTARFGKLAVLHGHEFGHSVFSPVNPARGLYLRAKESSLIGHHHQTSEHTEKQLGGKVVTCWSLGCLCGLQPEYFPFNKWSHGFAIVEFDKSGDYEVQNKRIVEGKVR